MATWMYPTEGREVTSGFNPARKHPVTGIVKPHTGTDFRAAAGTPLRAACDGTVVKSLFAKGSPGNYVRIDVGGGVWIGYSHLSERRVSRGDQVTSGQIIGLAGATGSATAAHLHFEVSVNGHKIDPVPHLEANVIAVAVLADKPRQPSLEDDMPTLVSSPTFGTGLLDGGVLTGIADRTTVDAWSAAGAKSVPISDGDFMRLIRRSTSTWLLFCPPEKGGRGFAVWSGGQAVGLGDNSTVESFKEAGVPVVEVALADFDRFTSA